MPIYDLEYTICVIQRGEFSFAAKSHRREDGNPRISIIQNPDSTTWILDNLDKGVPEIMKGQPQKDRIDFYFRHEDMKSLLSQFPRPIVTNNNGLRFAPLNSEGTERKEGKRVRMITPICRFYPLESVQLMVNKTPSFEAFASNAFLHLDFETGPKKIYGKEIFEVHFGIEADYVITKLKSALRSNVQLNLSNELYATIIKELNNVC